MFAIDTGSTTPSITPKSAGIDETQSVDLRNGERAERLRRQIIENIWAHETSIELEGYWEAESVILDAMWLQWPDFFSDCKDAYETQLSVLRDCERTQSAKADPMSAEPTNSLGIAF